MMAMIALPVRFRRRDTASLSYSFEDRSGRPVMRLGFCGVLVLMTACVMLPTSTARAAGPTKPVVTNKQRFRIPYKFDADALQKMNARELQLFVSRNRGGQWELAQSIPAQAGKFEFQAPADAEYWFVVKTIDGQGQAHPPGQNLDPGLMVVVDTQQPRFDLKLEALPAGKVQLSWQANDPNLDPASLRLEFMQPGSIDWQAVSVIPRNVGQTSWTCPQAGLVSVRGSIADLAGNTTAADTRLQVAGGGDAVPKPQVPDLRQPIAGNNTPAISSNDIPVIPEVQPAFPAPKSPPTPPPGQFITSTPAKQPEITQDRWPAATTTPEPGVNHVASPRQRMVNTRQFQLGYKVDDVGPSGIGGVELFITQDNGRRWFRYGEDADRSSPIDVKLQQDGEYGFTIRVRSGAGLANDPPTPGELPSMSVVVDMTPPTLELVSVEQGRGTELNQITIRWRTQDAHPAEKPISLYYSANMNGPWEPICTWRQDTGSFAWGVGPEVPGKMYIRVMSRDAAGNVSKVDSTQPLMVDMTRPTARIVDVEITPAPR